MENFVYSVPTTVYFGKGQVRHIADIVSTYGKSVLLVYGGGSIKRNGIYSDNQQLQVFDSNYYSPLMLFFTMISGNVSCDFSNK